MRKAEQRDNHTWTTAEKFNLIANLIEGRNHMGNLIHDSEMKLLIRILHAENPGLFISTGVTEEQIGAYCLGHLRVQVR